ncbi:Phosphate regulon transcriptional regulatory protein PhoB (SphR) [hydrothermal vent metagenome]|uniref:Phosphate regulon transcriptional regulatory protein PhoB (SphR) n=1 Tax=hydrothermal vent metagenome TaxID=652676 RepID=A0A3B1CSJ0_9ZZZZ
MSKKNILIVEDEKDIQELVRYNLAKEGYQVTLADSGEEGLTAVQSQKPDLVILDLMLPGADGLEVCRQMKNNPATADIPVIMLTARGDESDIVAGLELGADDYVTKPFSLKVLVTRVHAVLRRSKKDTPDDEDVLRFPELVIHSGRREVRVNDKTVALTFTEFGILKYLAHRPGWVFTRCQIVDAVRGDGYSVTERSVDFQIVGLRKKLMAAAVRIETVRGVGYRFKETLDE